MEASQAEYHEELKSDIKNISTRLSTLTGKVDACTDKNEELESKYKLLEEQNAKLREDIDRLKAFQMGHQSATIAELEDRRKRSFNIIILGCPEAGSPENHPQTATDKEEVLNILTTIKPDILADDVLYLHRLGRKTRTRRDMGQPTGGDTTPLNRPIKVNLTSPELAKTILKLARTSCPVGLTIVSDRTPCQQEELAALRRELLVRQKEDPNLTISYVNGVPKITKNTTKTTKPSENRQRQQ